MDFRTAAAEETSRRLGDNSASALDGSGQSGCLFIPGGRFPLVCQALAFNLVSLLCLLATLGLVVLGWTDRLPRRVLLPLLALALLVNLCARSVKTIGLKVYLSRRRDGWLRMFPRLERRSVGLEEGATYKKLKFVTEDQGICLLDPERHRFMLEGCAYRYVFYASDVNSVEPVSTFALSGARLHCRVAGQSLELVLTAAGPGPLASLVQSFAPHFSAAGLAMVLNRTLFGTATPSFTQRTLPPPLPQS